MNISSRCWLEGLAERPFSVKLWLAHAWFEGAEVQAGEFDKVVGPPASAARGGTMGGLVSVCIAVLAVVVFYHDGKPILCGVAVFVALICFWTWRQMAYFARVLARNRLFVEALERREIVQGTPSANEFWHTMKVTIEQRDVDDVPDWVTVLNMLATLVALALLVWGGVAARM